MRMKTTVMGTETRSPITELAGRGRKIDNVKEMRKKQRGKERMERKRERKQTARELKKSNSDM